MVNGKLWMLKCILIPVYSHSTLFNQVMIKSFKTGLILFISLTLSASVAFSQDYKTNIETSFGEYLDHLMNKEFEQSLEYLTPEFFEIFPKDKMIMAMEQAFNNPGMKYEIINPEILSVGDKVEIESKHYALITYSNQLNIKFLNEEPETDEEKELRLNMTQGLLKTNFGEENVVLNNETEFFEIQSQKDAYAISENGSSDWKFLVIEKDQKPILEKLLPAELAEKI